MISTPHTCPFYLLCFHCQAIPGNVTWAPDGGAPTNNKKSTVLRSVITPFSCLIGKTIEEASFFDNYKASVLALMRRGKNYRLPLPTARLEADDLLILHAAEGSPLLLSPPADFYKKLHAAHKNKKSSDDPQGFGYDSQVSRYIILIVEKVLKIQAL